MSQYNWTYVGGAGRNYNVTLFHGKRTGHLMILLNAQVVQIDFSVRESKTYSFFIEDEFCLIRLERRGEEMYYFFEIDKKVDTPRNRERKKQDRRYLLQGLVFFGLLIALATGAALGFQAYNKQLDRKRMDAAAYADSTVGWIELDTLTASRLIRYHYVAANRTFSGSSFSPPGAAPWPLMPLEQGDEFQIRYHPRHPEFSRIYFEKPTGRQQQRYLERALALHLRLHPDLHPQLARCMLSLALERKGAEGLADFFFQESKPEENPSYNRDSYHRLVRDPAFQREVENRCWK